MPAKKEKNEEEHQRKQEEKEKKQLAEGQAKKHISCKRHQNEATVSSVCRKLPTQDQLVNEEEEQGTNTPDSTSRPKHRRQLPA